MSPKDLAHNFLKQLEFCGDVASGRLSPAPSLKGLNGSITKESIQWHSGYGEVWDLRQKYEALLRANGQPIPVPEGAFEYAFKTWPADLYMSDYESMPDVTSQREEATAWFIANGCPDATISSCYPARDNNGRTVGFRFCLRKLLASTA